MLRRLAIQIFWILLGATVAHAEATLLLEEPFGGFWSMNPAHSAIYLSRVCAETTVKLRRCRDGELGIVISRYRRIGGYDWIAIPLIPYLYSVETEDRVPSAAGLEEIVRLRDRYRRDHLKEIAPAQSGNSIPSGDWTQLLGEAFDRAIYGFTIETTQEQDDLLIADFNARPNRARFNLLFRNCANFAASVINFYDPRLVRRSFFPDFGIMTPRQVAKRVIRYGQRHREVHFSIFVIAQVPGAKRRSKAMRGILSMIESEKFTLPPFRLSAALASSD